MIHDTAAASLLATTAPEGTIDNLNLPWSFLTAIDVLLAHATTDNTRGAMTGILLERHAECTYLVSTDGYAALVLRTDALDGPPGTLVLDPASVRAWRARFDPVGGGVHRPPPGHGQLPQRAGGLPDARSDGNVLRGDQHQAPCAPGDRLSQAPAAQGGGRGRGTAHW